MKKRSLKIIVSLFIIMIASCNEPETVVTDIIHPDGSVTRKIEMKNSKNEFPMKSMKVPLDNTWKISDSLEIGKKGDTTWVKRAEKLYANVDELNASYKSDSGANRDAKRHVEFKKQFRWFTTDYVFSENVDRKFLFGYPISKFLNKEELGYFYSPSKLRDEQINGPDSLKYRAIYDTISKKTDRWTFKSIISEWIGQFELLTPGRTEKELTSQALKAREDEFAVSIEKYSHNFDSLWASGTILTDYFGETIAKKYKQQFDSSMSIVEKIGLADFKDYSLKIVMPGKLTGTNGFMDSSHVLLWPVKSDYFLTEQYSMWAESKVTNTWAWIVTGLFLVFVAAGLIIRRIRK
jgi:hypothetical protein